MKPFLAILGAFFALNWGFAQSPTAPHAVDVSSTTVFVPDNNTELLTIGSGASIEFWVKPNALSGTSYLLEKDGRSGTLNGFLPVNNFLEIYTEDDSLAIDIKDSNGVDFNHKIDISASVSLNEWSHVAFVFDRVLDSLYIYIDGAVVSSEDIASIDDINNSNHFYIGSNSVVGSLGLNRFDGQLDEFRFWSKVLTASEIESNIHTQFDSTTANLEGYYQFDQGSGLVVYDYTSNHRNGSLTSTAAWVNISPASASISGVTSLLKNNTETYTASYSNSDTRVFKHDWVTANGNVTINSTDSIESDVFWTTPADSAYLYYTYQYSNWNELDTAELIVEVVNCGVLEGDTGICNIDTITLNAIPVGATSYSWTSESTTFSGSLDSLPNVSFGGVQIASPDTVYLTIVDGSYTCYDTVTVTPFNDYTAPTFNVFNDTTLYVPDSVCIIKPFLTGADSSFENYFINQGWVTDSQSGIFLVQQDAGVADTNQYTIGVTRNSFYAMDFCLNIAYDTFSITVVDTVRPSVSTFTDTVFINAAGIASTNPSRIDSSSTDNCQISTRVLVDTLFDCSDLNTYSTVINDDSVYVGNGANKLNTPYSIYQDGSGNIYVSDFLNHRVQRWAPGATTGTTVAGGNGQGSAANQLSNPAGLWVNSSGGVYVSDFSNNRIQYWAPGASTGTTVAGGNGQGNGTNQLNRPAGVFVDGSNNVYIADTYNHRIQRWASSASSGTTVAGGNGQGDSISQLSLPYDIAVVNSKYFIADFGNNRIQRWNFNDTVGTTVAGYDTAGSTLRLLDAPTGLFVTSAEDVYVADKNNNRIVLWGASDTVGTLVAGGNSPSASNKSLNYPRDVYVNGTDIYIADTENHRVVGWEFGDTTGTVEAGSLTIEQDTSVVRELLINYTVSDTNGNSTIVQAQVIIYDTIAPVAKAKNDTVYLDASGNATLSANDVEDGSTDNCMVDSTWLSQSTFTCADVGLDTVQFIARDSSFSYYRDLAGAYNYDTVDITVLVRDTIIPTPIGQNRTIYLDVNGAASITAAQIDNGSFDNCSIDTLTLSKYNFTCSDTGDNNVVLTALDVNGNSNTTTVTVTVIDNIAPTPVVNTPITVYLDTAGTATVTTSQVNGGSYDNCSITLSTLSKSAFGCNDLGSNSVTYTITDQSGNSSNATVFVNVLDTIKPIVHTQNMTLYLDANGQASINASQVNNGSSDNCTVDSVYLSQYDFSCSDIGVNNETFTALDINGNQRVGAFTVTVYDTTRPILYARNLDVYLNGAGFGSISINQVDSNSWDNCNSFTRTISDSTFTCADIGSNTLTFSAQDAQGNSTSISFEVTVIDSVKPTLVTQSPTIYLDTAGNATITVNDINTNSYDSCGIDTIYINTNSFNCNNVGANTVTITSTDIHGNTKSSDVTVQVADTVRPTLITNAISIYLNASGTASITANDIDGGSYDNCGLQSTSISRTTFNCNNIGNNLVVFTAVDLNGNTRTRNVIVNVYDTISPTLQLNPITVSLNNNGQASVLFYQVDNGTFDNCGLQSSVLSQNNFTCADLGTRMVAATATDLYGNVTVDSVAITVVDQTAPVVIAQNLTVYLDPSGDASITSGMINNGSYDNCSISHFALSDSTFTCVDLGINQVTLNAYDSTGNSGSAIALVTVVDTVSPVAVAQNVTLYLGSNGSVNLQASLADAGSYDNCGIQTWSVSQVVFSCADTGSNSVILTVIDSSGNSNSAPFIATVIDSSAPDLQVQNIQLTLSASGAASFTFADINTGSTDNCMIQSVTFSQSSFTCADTGNNNVTVTATDRSGNSATEVIQVEVLDLTAPTITIQPVTAYLNASGQVTVSASALNNGTIDNCSVAQIWLSDSIFNCSDVGSNTVTFYAQDVSGNISNTAATIQIIDSISPQVNGQNVTAYLDANGSVSITANQVDNGSIDECGIQSLTLSKYTFNCLDLGANSVTLTATDNNGNTASTSVQVTIVDTVSPQVSVQNVSIFLGSSGDATLYTSQVNQGSTDNCALASMSLSDSTFTCLDLGTNTVYYTATDSSGNSTTEPVIVTVIDSTSPQLMLTNTVVYLDASGNYNMQFTDVDAGSVDNCNIQNVNFSTSSFTCGDIGFHTVQVTVYDQSSNSSTASVVVEVRDSLAPQIAGQNMTVYLGANGQVTLNPQDLDNGSVDNCSIAQYLADITQFNCTDLGANTVNFKVVDTDGNRDSVDVTVTVDDTLLPTVLAQPTTIYLDASGNATLAVSQVDNGTYDNCTLQQLSLSNTAFTCADEGLQQVYLIAEDQSGNIDSASVFVTVSDTIKPTVVTQPVTLYLNASGVALLSPNDVDNGTYDNCGVQFTGVGQTTFTCNDIGTNQVVFTAQDVNGNFQNGNVDVTVVDTVSPVIATQTISIYLDANGQTSTTPQAVNAGTADNCMLDSISLSQTNFDCSEVGANTVTFTAIDIYGNVSTAPVVINVLDTILPQVLTQPITVYLDANGEAIADPNTAIVSTNDNCSVSSTTFVQSVFGCNDLGVNQVELQVEDPSGNIRRSMVQITVLDTIAPEIICPADVQTCESSVQYDIPQITDNCTDLDYYLVSGPYPGTSVEIGTYDVVWQVEDQSGNTNQCSFTAVVNPIPEIRVQADTSVYYGDDLQLWVTSDIPSTYQWFPEDLVSTPRDSITLTAPTEAVTYTAVVTSEQGCENQKEVVVNIHNNVNVGTAFTPNGDGINDYFEVQGLDEYDFVSVKIYNRNGQMVYESNDYHNDWDGTYNGEKLPAASYYFILNLGSGHEGITGIVTIIN